MLSTAAAAGPTIADGPGERPGGHQQNPSSASPKITVFSIIKWLVIIGMCLGLVKTLFEPERTPMEQVQKKISSGICVLAISALLLACANQSGFFDGFKEWWVETSDSEPSVVPASSGSLTPTQRSRSDTSHIRLTQSQSSKTESKNLGLDWRWVVVIGVVGLFLLASVVLLCYLFREDEKFDDLEAPAECVRPKRRRYHIHRRRRS